MNPIKLIVEQMMIPFLNFSYHYIAPNYGIAIILLTLLLKIIFYPLTRQQSQTMAMQKKIQPELKAIQEKYKGQPEKVHKEMMRLWKENNINPLSGCLPTLIQIPFFIAIFYTIKSAKFTAILNTPGIYPGFLPFWITNLTMPDKTFILPVLVALSTYFYQKMVMTDPQQAKIFMFMPFLMLYICFKLPSGVLLFWVVSQGAAIIHQLYITRMMPQTAIEPKNKKES